MILFVWLQLFCRQGPVSLSFLARILLTRPAQFTEAARLAIKGWHFYRFTQQTLAAHAFQAEALEAYDRLARLADRAAVGSARVRAAVSRQGAKARRRLRLLYRRLRPEFRKSLVPDRAGIETALREMAKELAEIDLVRRWTPRIRDWFAGASWHRALHGSGYAPQRAEAYSRKIPTVALAPLVSEPAARLYSYLRAIAPRIDVLVVPLADGAEGIADHVKVLATRAAELPRLVCVGLEGGRRELRRRLIELGIALTGDVARAQDASERACAFI